MGRWDIKSKDGNTTRATIHNLTYNGEWMGDRYVEVTVKSPAPIAFTVGDTLTYRGEVFTLDYIPSAEKVSSKDSYGEAFVYEGIQFKSYVHELVDTQFCDYVENDNLTHYTGLGTFSFYVQTIEDFARRIRANLNRRYGNDMWTVTVGPNADIDDQSVSISSGTSVYNALSLVSTQFKLNFTVKGRTITIGPELQTLGEDTFRYGRGNGLLSIKQLTSADNAVITRLRAYGNTRNMPYRYYNKKYNDRTKYPELFDAHGNYLLESKYMPNLMLPYSCWKNRTFDAYIDADDATLGIGNGTINEYGIKEGEKIFDTDDKDWHDIYPTLTDMTTTELRSANGSYAGSRTYKEESESVSVDGDGYLDRIIGGSASTDNGTNEDGNFAAMVATTEIVIPNIGFNLTTYKNESETPTITFKSGMCSGRGMEILACDPASATDESQGYKLTLKRAQDTVIGMVYPNTTFEIQAGDQYVITGINLPDVYVEAAEQRLLEEAKKFLRKYDHTIYTYEPKIDNEFMARHTEVSDNIIEGMLFPFEDLDLGIAGNIPIKHLTIKEGDEIIPQYEVVLDEEAQATTLEKMQADIEDAKSYASYPTGTFIRILSDRFLRKDTPDTAQRLITFLEGIALGSEDGKYYLDADGFARLFRIVASSITSSRYTAGDEGIGYSMWEDTDGTGNLTIDNLKVRRKMSVAELEVRKKTYTSGNLSLGKAGNTIFAVRPYRHDGTPIADMVFAVDGVAIAVQDGGVTVLGKKTKNETPSYYRCYFLRTDGERTVDNCWEVGDDAKCQTSNLTEGTTRNAANRYYWRLVVGKGTETLEDGREYHYVDLSNEESPVVEMPMIIKGEALRVVATHGESSSDFGDYAASIGIIPKAGDVYLYTHTDGPGTQPEVITYATDTEYTVLVPEQDDIYRTADGKYYRADLDYNGDQWIETTATQQVLQGYDTSADNDAPMTGDDIAQEGNQVDKDRQGLMVLDSEEGISKYKGINGFTYEGKRKQHIGDTVELEVNRLTIVSEAPDGTPEEYRVPCYMGAWTARPYPYYTQVDCDGSIWLCARPAGARAADRPHDGSTVWHKQVSKGESIDIKGSVPSASALPSGAQDGDCYITDDDGHLHRYQGGSWRDLGQLKGLDGHPGADAELYRLVPVTERAVVGRGGKLTASLSYNIEHVVGSTVTAAAATADLRVRYRGNAGTPASTDMSTGDTPSATYVLEDYPHVPHPDYIIVELVDAEETVHDRRTVPVTFSTVAALDINGQVGEITARVQGMAGGGRNLLKGTAFDKARDDFYRLSSGAIIDPNRRHGGHNSVDCTAAGQTSDIYKGVFFKADVEAGREYTASVWTYGAPATIDNGASLEIIYTDADGHRQQLAAWSIKPTLADAWQRVSHTFRVPAGVPEIECNFFVVRNGRLHIAEPMLTSGNMLVDWQPAPEDAEAFLTELKMSITNLSLSITDLKTGLEAVGIHLFSTERPNIRLVGNSVAYYDTTGKMFMSQGVGPGGEVYFIIYDNDGVTPLYNLGRMGMQQIIGHATPYSMEESNRLGPVPPGTVLTAVELWSDLQTTQYGTLRHTSWLYTEAYTLDGQGGRLYQYGGVYNGMYDSPAVDGENKPTGNRLPEDGQGAYIGVWDTSDPSGRLHSTAIVYNYPNEEGKAAERLKVNLLKDYYGAGQDRYLLSLNGGDYTEQMTVPLIAIRP